MRDPSGDTERFWQLARGVAADVETWAEGGMPDAAVRPVEWWCPCGGFRAEMTWLQAGVVVQRVTQRRGLGPLVLVPLRHQAQGPYRLRCESCGQGLELWGGWLYGPEEVRWAWQQWRDAGAIDVVQRFEGRPRRVAEAIEVVQPVRYETHWMAEPGRWDVGARRLEEVDEDPLPPLEEAELDETRTCCGRTFKRFSGKGSYWAHVKAKHERDHVTSGSEHTPSVNLRREEG